MAATVVPVTAGGATATLEATVATLIASAARAVQEATIAASEVAASASSAAVAASSAAEAVKTALTLTAESAVMVLAASKTEASAIRASTLAQKAALAATKSKAAAVEMARIATTVEVASKMAEVTQTQEKSIHVATAAAEVAATAAAVATVAAKETEMAETATSEKQVTTEAKTPEDAVDVTIVNTITAADVAKKAAVAATLTASATQAATLAIEHALNVASSAAKATVDAAVSSQDTANKVLMTAVAEQSVIDAAKAISQAARTTVATTVATASTIQATQAAHAAVGVAVKAATAAMSAATATQRAATAAVVATEAVEASSRFKTQFIAALSHELRAPLNPVTLIIETLLERMNHTRQTAVPVSTTTVPASEHPCAVAMTPVHVPPDMVSDLCTMRDCIAMETALIDDLLDITRISGGKLLLKKATLDIHALLQDSIDVCKMTAHDVLIRSDLRAMHRYCTGDATRLKQVFWNLLRNAIKFTPNEGTITVTTYNRLKPHPPLPQQATTETTFPAVVHVNTTIAAGPTTDAAQRAVTLAASMGMVAAPNTDTATESGLAADSELVVVVSDTGIGMDASQVQGLFRAFAQGDSNITRQFGGLGLGLHIASTIMALHSGTIAAYSAGTNAGSAFTVTMDCVEPPLAAESATQPPQQLFRTDVVDLAALRVLLVEDNTMTLRLMQRTLSRFGICHLYTATSVQESVQVMQQLKQHGTGPAQGITAVSPSLDLLISDMGLPDGCGLDVMIAARRLFGAVRDSVQRIWNCR